MPRAHIRLILTTTSLCQPSLPRHHRVYPTSPLSPLLQGHSFTNFKSPALISPRSPHPSTECHKPYFSALSSPINFPPSPLPPPPSPHPWTWTCHLCTTTYRLSTTRRCLIDGHYLCTAPATQSPPPPPSSPSPSPVSPCAPSSRTESQHSPPPPLAERQPYTAPGAGSQQRTRKGGASTSKRETKHRPHCSTMFDYVGWMERNEWRRRRRNDDEAEEEEVVVGRTSRTMLERGSRTGKGVGEGREKVHKDCFVDCDFPSECSWRETGAYMEAVSTEKQGEGVSLV